jgi:CrcB protein
MTVLLVIIGGAVGAVCRYAAGRLTLDRPAWATFAVNVTGSLILGLLAGFGAGLPAWVGALVGTGFCGALTTYSTFAYETITLGRWWGAVNAAASLAVGIGAATLGFTLSG